MGEVNRATPESLRPLPEATGRLVMFVHAFCIEPASLWRIVTTEASGGSGKMNCENRRRFTSFGGPDDDQKMAATL